MHAGDLNKLGSSHLSTEHLAHWAILLGPHFELILEYGIRWASDFLLPVWLSRCVGAFAEQTIQWPWHTCQTVAFMFRYDSRVSFSMSILSEVSHVDQSALKPRILLYQHPKWWNYRQAPPCQLHCPFVISFVLSQGNCGSSESLAFEFGTTSSISGKKLGSASFFHFSLVFRFLLFPPLGTRSSGHRAQEA